MIGARRFRSIRFRLSLGIALAVFCVGTLFVGLLYAWQANRLVEPVLTTRQVLIEDASTGRQFETGIDVLLPGDVQRAAMAQLEIDAYRKALDELRRAAFVGLVALFVVSFAAGWMLSGWVLLPIEQMNRVARSISVGDLSRRIDLAGPDDELKGLAKTFDAMLDRLQQAFETQRRFIHETSHELRNPLAVARTNLEVALAEDDPDGLRHAAQLALGSTERMTVLVDELLEQARQGVPELSRSRLDVRALMAEIADEFGAAAARRRLRISAEDGGPVMVEADGPAIRRAVSNLVANAVRLAPSGTSVTLAAVESPTEVSLVVTDEGPGIPPPDVDRVFDRFWRGDDEGSGSGLGLSLVRQIAERHGGSAGVESTVGSGSIFTVRLPRRSERTRFDAGAPTMEPEGNLGLEL